MVTPAARGIDPFKIASRSMRGVDEEPEARVRFLMPGNRSDSQLEELLA